MDFGKLDNVDRVDFSLPPVPKETLEVLNKTGKSGQAELFIGCPVWGEKDWVGKIYPSGTKPKEFLHYYATQFNCIELNSTHYNFPNELLAEKWKADVPADFKFCPKITQDISHINRLVNVESMVETYCTGIRYLENNLGTVFLQLPPDFAPDIKIVTHFIEKWPKDVPLAIEFRHAGWFDKRISTEMFTAMQANNIGTVISDVAARRDAAHMRLTNGTAFIRFQANDLHPSDFSRMDAWSALLHEWNQQGLETAYFFLHTKTRYINLDLAIYLIGELNKKGYKLKPPYPWKEPKKPEAQTRLF